MPAVFLYSWQDQSCELSSVRTSPINIITITLPQLLQLSAKGCTGEEEYEGWMANHDKSSWVVGDNTTAVHTYVMQEKREFKIYTEKQR